MRSGGADWRVRLCTPGRTTSSHHDNHGNSPRQRTGCTRRATDPRGEQLIHEGTVRHITIAHDGHTIAELDRKSTRLNSSHSQISYAVFCLKKKTKKKEKTSHKIPRC